ncbi:C-C motif chemokine 3-like [Colossoma macropomum]|uniref:C-C motif chemokine 3-like n=1 Tax=Colossoma macropomum TaxID=42526 RepID=UPI001863E31A|nr:C-C motif chemokine 3-like [Colossoma macropomum]
MEMKMSCVCLVLGLVLLMTVSSDAGTYGTDSTGHPVQCCFSFFKAKIPPKLIVKVEKTPSECPKPGYVVTTRKAKLCKQEGFLES